MNDLTKAEINTITLAVTKYILDFDLLVKHLPEVYFKDDVGVWVKIEHEIIGFNEIKKMVESDVDGYKIIPYSIRADCVNERPKVYIKFIVKKVGEKVDGD